MPERDGSFALTPCSSKALTSDARSVGNVPVQAPDVSVPVQRPVPASVMEPVPVAAPPVWIGPARLAGRDRPQRRVDRQPHQRPSVVSTGRPRRREGHVGRLLGEAEPRRARPGSRPRSGRPRSPSGTRRRSSRPRTWRSRPPGTVRVEAPRRERDARGVDARHEAEGEGRRRRAVVHDLHGAGALHDAGDLAVEADRHEAALVRPKAMSVAVRRAGRVDAAGAHAAGADLQADPARRTGRRRAASSSSPAPSAARPSSPGGAGAAAPSARPRAGPPSTCRRW